MTRKTARTMRMRLLRFTREGQVIVAIALGVGFAAIKLLEDAGCEVEVPMTQTCCGQPAYNSGDRADARALAEQVIEAFERYDYVVAPSGSCAGMLKKHYPGLFRDDAGWRMRAEVFAGKVHELVSFLVDVRACRRDDG